MFTACYTKALGVDEVDVTGRFGGGYLKATKDFRGTFSVAHVPFYHTCVDVLVATAESDCGDRAREVGEPADVLVGVTGPGTRHPVQRDDRLVTLIDG